MTVISGRKTVARSHAQRAVSKLMLTSALVAAGSLAFASAAVAADYELPSFGSVVSGTIDAPVTSGLNNENMTINQTSNRVIINWNTFNIGADASVNFQQLGADSLAVNRVSNDGQFSRINGRLTANGKVMILDPNGVMFGAGSVIDVGAIVASTGDVDAARVMAGDLALQLSNFGTGQIVNNGTINAADSGLVAFVASTVKNHGVINANLGRVSLAAGNETATVDLYGDGLVSLAYTDKNEDLLSKNTGTINAVGGTIQMTAAAAKNVVDSVVNMNGIATANSAVVTNGKIVLSAKKVKVGSSAQVKGNTDIKAKSVDLSATIDGVVTGAADEVNVKSNAAKIAQGLNVVNENGTVNVAAGTYNEHLVVDKRGVTLNGSTVGNTIVVPNSPGVTITADNVTVDGFTFTGALGLDGYGIFVNNADNVTLRNNTINNTSRSGIYLLGSDNVQILNNRIGVGAGNNNIGQDGILVDRSHGVVIKGNTITETTSTAAEIGSGVHLLNSNNAIVGGPNLADRNTISNAEWDAVKVTAGSNILVEGNDFDNLDRVGVFSRDTNGIVVRNNDIDNALMYGVQFFGAKGVSYVTGNQIDRIGIHGIDLYYSTNVKVTDNVIGYGNNGVLGGGDDTVIGRDGLSFRFSGGTEATNNKVAHTTRYGVSVEGQSNVKLFANTVDYTGKNGMNLLNTSGTQIFNNKIGTVGVNNNINGDGILVDRSNGVVIMGNTITETKSTASEVGSGVHLLNSNNATVGGMLVGQRNTISNAEWDAVKITAGSNLLVEGNDFDNLNRVGVYAKNTNGLAIRNNDIDDARMYGVQVDGVSGSTSITGNMIDKIGLDGISVRYGSRDVSIENNVIGYGPDGFVETPEGNYIGRDGVNIVYSTGTNVNRNRIARTGRTGVYADAAAHTNVSNNNIDFIGLDGISLNSASDSTVSGNLIGDYSGAVRDGVRVTNSARINIADNIVLYSGANGIYVRNSSDFLNIDSNHIYDTVQNGILIEDAEDYVGIIDNDIYRSGWDGIRVSSYYGGYSPVPPMIEIYSLLDAPLEGLNIIGNYVTDSSDDGIDVRYATGLIDISENEVFESGANGINLNDSTGNILIDSNDIRNSYYDGISVGYVNQYGRFDGPFLMAMYDEDSYSPYSQLTITNNDIDNSGQNGISLYQVGGPVLVETNHITDSGENGVYALNYGYDDYYGGEGEDFGTFAFRGYYNPIQLRLIDNTIENIGFVPGAVEGGGGVEELFAAIIDDGYFPEDYKPQGFAAINLDISAEGTAEISDNRLGNNFDYGLVAYSGTIDLTGATNTIRNTGIGMGFYPTFYTPEVESDEYFAYLANKLKLVDNTIGSTEFIDQSELFVDLGYGAFFAPGTPTILNGNDASYTLAGSTIAPSLSGGVVTPAEYIVLENFFNHYVDAQNRGLFFFDLLDLGLGIDQKDVFRNALVIPFGDNAGGSLTITGLPRVNGQAPANIGGGTAPGAFNPNAIEPAAGDEATGDQADAGNVADIQPAAGGADNSSCWADATQSLGQGAAVTVNFGTAPSALLQDTANCGNGQGQAL